MYKVIGSDQKIYGPVSVDQIRRWLAEGRVNSTTLLQAEGSNEWKPLSSIPEFGIPPVVSMPPPVPVKRDNGMAIAGLTCGVLSNICCCFGVICAILGIIFSIIALNQHETHPQQGSKSLALAGLILSVVGLTWHCFLPWSLGFHPAMWHVFHRQWRNW
jgi:hypothetical protein